MAEIPVMFSGVLYPKDRMHAPMPVVFIGVGWNPDLGIGGGPVYPPAGGGPPPGIWGPTDPRPTPPIAMPPGGGAQPPLVIWGPDDPRPTNPIVIPPGSIAPGVPTHPIFLPVYPSHPIVLPPEGGTPPEQPEQPPVEVKVGW